MANLVVLDHLIKPTPSHAYDEADLISFYTHYELDPYAASLVNWLES